MHRSTLSQRTIRYGALVLTCAITYSAHIVYAESHTVDNQPTVEHIRQVLDWVPLSKLSQEQRQQLPAGSCGAYISPLNASDSQSVNPAQAPVYASSNSAETTGDNTNKNITLVGDVVVTQGYRQLMTERATINQTAGTMDADGELVIREPDLLLVGDKAHINQQQNSLRINNASYVIHSSRTRGHATEINKQSNGTISLQESSYTQCEPGNNTWVLKGSQMVIDTEKQQGIARHVRLVIKGIPVFYWPYLRFPVGDKRQSGFLFPSITADRENYSVALPYYFNLAPNYDLTFTPQVISNHGTLFELNGRHLSRSFATEISLGHIGNDRDELDEDDQDLVDAGTISEAEARPYQDEDRWLVSVKQQGGVGRRWSSTIDYTEVSDNDYLRDFDNATLSTNSKTSLNQQIKASYQFDHWQLGINNQQYQTLSDSIAQPFKQLPQVTFNGQYRWGNWDTTLNHEWVRFDHTNADDPGDTTLVGNRTRAHYSVGWNGEAEAGFLRPRIQLKHLSYQLDADKLASNADTSPSLTVPQASLDGGLFFERNGNGYLHTLEPRLFYFYSDFEDQADLTNTGRVIDFDTSELTFSYSQLFRDTRFSGGDRIDDANQLALGLTTRFIDNNSGRQWFSASIGQILYFDDRRVTLNGVADDDNRSAIASQLTASMGEHWKLSNDLLYSDERHQLDKGNLSLRYHGNNSHLFNLNYRYLRAGTGTSSTTDIRQADTSVIFPFGEYRWYGIAHIAYDFSNDRELEQLFGVEYNGCCYRVRLAYQRFLDNDLVNIIDPNDLEYDEGVLLEFELRGLGSTSKQLDTLLTDSVDGYQQWQATHR